MTTSITTASINTSSVPAAPARKTCWLRQLSLKWDLYGVVTLMAFSTAYGLFALAHAA